MEVINKHVSVRRFKDKGIQPEILESIIYSGSKASTTGNMQLYSVVISETIEDKSKLIPYHFNQMVARNAPVLLTIVADYNRFTKWCTLNSAQPGYDNFISFFTAVIDALLFAQNLCLAAENYGLGICYLGTTTYNAREIINVLNLPKLTFPVTTIALGYPSETPEYVDRIPVEGIIHKSKYKEYTDKTIKDLYSFKENLDSSKKFISENKKETLAQVFTDIRYKKADNEIFSEKMLEVMREQGFLK
jgi:nitroreductase